MKLRKIYMPGEIVKGKEFCMNTIMLKLDNGIILTSTDFHHKRKLPLICNCYLPAQDKWIKMYAKNQYTETMWNFYRQKKVKADKKYNGNYANMMKHSRKKKTGGSGLSRENIRAITDYECSKNPLYDFRMCYN